jgi:hypothetical protein
MNGGWVFLIIIILLGLLGGGGWFAYQKFYKNRSDSTFPYPSPAPSGIADRVKEVWHRIRNPKTQTGAGYESTSGGYAGAPSGRRGHALDPDEAWDSRVGNEADVYGPGGYYEEQELGLHQSTEYRGASGFRQTETLGAPTAGGAGERGRSASPGRSNPFGDDNAASLRGVSPRPRVDTNAGASAHGGRRSAESSPTFERRSIFRENV